MIKKLLMLFFVCIPMHLNGMSFFYGPQTSISYDVYALAEYKSSPMYHIVQQHELDPQEIIIVVPRFAQDYAQLKGLEFIDLKNNQKVIVVKNFYQCAMSDDVSASNADYNYDLFEFYGYCYYLIHSGYVCRQNNTFGAQLTSFLKGSATWMATTLACMVVQDTITSSIIGWPRKYYSEGDKSQLIAGAFAGLICVYRSQRNKDDFVINKLIESGHYQPLIFEFNRSVASTFSMSRLIGRSSKIAEQMLLHRINICDHKTLGVSKMVHDVFIKNLKEAFPEIHAQCLKVHGV